MNHSQLKRSPLCNFKKYKITLTTSFETKHGISGHLFEMIEYFWHFRIHKNINTAILISDGTTKEEFFGCLHNKYNFNESELELISNNTFFIFQPLVILANNIIFVDGSLRVKNADVFASKKIFIRCSDDEYLDKADIVLQDYDLYDKLDNSVHYKKKLLFSKFKKYEDTNSNTAMFYTTSNMRKLSYDDLSHLTDKYKFDNYILLSNDNINTPSNIELKKIPVQNLWQLFDTYIYTGSTNISKIDCSSRFIVECKYYNKNVIYNNMQFDKGLEVRRYDIEHNINLELKEDDEITKIITII